LPWAFLSNALRMTAPGAPTDGHRDVRCALMLAAIRSEAATMLKRFGLPTLLGAVVLLAGLPAAAAEPPANPLIDAAGFQQIVADLGATQETRRLDEAGFLAAMREPGVVLLDARSADRYAELHIDGAVNLPFTDFTAASLAAILPRPDTRVLIYCNNNFTGSPRAFASKAPAASLNLSTWAALAAYGYDNVWELGPLVSVDDTRLPLVGSLHAATAGR